MPNKCIVIGVTGGIAAFKAASLVSNLIKKGYEVHVVMTKSATEFITPLTFETLSKNRVSIDTFARDFTFDVHHISLAKKADVFAIVPATANFIAKAVCGIADDMLSTTFLAANCKKIICPAMNTGMLNNPVTQKNLRECENLGYEIVSSEAGLLACGDIGDGRLASVETIEEAIEMALIKEKPLKGKHVLVSAGSTQESLDPVRFIRNHSSGKMGYAIAKMAKALGANVTLVSAPTEIKPPMGVNILSVKSAHDMFLVFKENYSSADIIIKAAAVADFTPKNKSEHKIKKKNADFNLELDKTEDILKWLGENKLPNQFLCGFAMETEDLILNAKEKLLKKNADMIVANSLSTPKAGFAVDTNVATIILDDKEISCPLMSKEDLALEIFNVILGRM